MLNMFCMARMQQLTVEECIKCHDKLQAEGKPCPQEKGEDS